MKAPKTEWEEAKLMASFAFHSTSFIYLFIHCLFLPVHQPYPNLSLSFSSLSFLDTHDARCPHTHPNAVLPHPSPFLLFSYKGLSITSLSYKTT